MSISHPRRWILNGSIFRNSAKPIAIWNAFKSSLTAQDNLCLQYKVGVDMYKAGSNDLGRTLTVNPEDVIKVLNSDEGAQILAVREFEQSGKLPKQYIHYFESGFLAADTYNFDFSWDDFLRRLSNVSSFVNFICADSKYRSETKKSFMVESDRDLRKYPGWFVERDGYLEGVSAEMWLGEPFWRFAACSKENVLNADWLKVENRGSHLHVVAWPEPFTSAEGEQGEIQRRLLKLLFGRE